MYGKRTRFTNCLTITNEHAASTTNPDSNDQTETTESSHPDADGTTNPDSNDQTETTESSHPDADGTTNPDSNGETENDIPFHG